jgi:hypothetical protein
MANRVLSFDGDGVRVALGASSVEITTLKPGRVYRVSAMQGNALIEDSTDSATTSNYAFAVPAGTVVYWRCSSAIVNVIENDTTSDAAAAVSFDLVSEDVD